MTRSLLLAGSAAIALIAGASAAFADDVPPGKFQVTVGGDAYFEAGAVSQNHDPNTRTTDFIDRFRLVVTPTATADNGIQYGAQIRIRAANSNGTTDADRAYIFVQGKFGTLQAGGVNGALSQYYSTTIAPTDYGTGGVDGDFSYGWLKTIGNAQPGMAEETGPGGGAIYGSESATKVNYITPRFLGNGTDTGVLLALSFAPNLSTNRADQATSILRNKFNNSAQTDFSGNPIVGFYSNAYEAFLHYTNTFNGVSVSAGAGYTGASADRTASSGAAGFSLPNGTPLALPAQTRFYDLSVYHVGAQIGYAGFLLGGSYQNAGKSGYEKGYFATEQSVWTAGLEYTTGPLVVGFGFLQSSDAGSVYVPGSRTEDLYTFGATYTVAPGLTVGAEYDRNNMSSSSADAAQVVSQTGSNGNSTGSNVFLLKSVVTF